MPPALLADLLLVAHLLFILGVIVPVPLIVIGGFRGWHWVRRASFRFTHLGMIGVVVAESVLGVMCPLTVWENALRAEAEDASYGNSFIAYWVSRLIYLDLPSWAFTVTYCAFGGVIVGLFWLIPVNFLKKA